MARLLCPRLPSTSIVSSFGSVNSQLTCVNGNKSSQLTSSSTRDIPTLYELSKLIGNSCIFPSLPRNQGVESRIFSIGNVPLSPPAKQNFQGVTRAASVSTTMGSLYGDGFKFAVIVGRFNDFITKELLAGALESFQRHGVNENDIEVVWVPGCFELPIVAQAMGKSGKFDVVLCIGAVIRGATTHYDAVANSAASGILSAGLNSGVPVIFGVLTCDNLEQAIDRAGGKAGNKGGEAAVTAIEMASLMSTLKQTGSAAS